MATPLNILVIGCSEEDLPLFASELEAVDFSPELRRVCSGEEMAKALDAQTYNAIIAEYHIPYFGVSNALELLHERNMDVPFIIVSDRVGEDAAVACMKLGASDYVLRDKLARLGPAMQRELREAENRRCHLIAQVELKKAKENAEKAFREKTTFLANLAHELRTPMMSVSGIAELLHETSLTMKQRDYVKRIENASHMLLGLFDDLLDMSKIEAGHLEFEDEVFSPRELLEEVVQILDDIAREKNISIAAIVDPEFPTNILAPRQRIRQILVNLIGNAIKFTVEGGVIIKLEKGEKEFSAKDEKAELVFSVCDTGPGIPEDQQKEIFEPFKRGSSTRNSKESGTGLGLAISKTMAEKMGGNIELETVLGKGSTFWLRIPVKVSKEKSPDTSRIKKEESEISMLRIPLRSSGEEPRILLAEDSEDASLIINEFLKHTQCTLDVVRDGSEAVEAFARDEYDLILMDMSMVGMDGFEATRMIRDIEKRSSMTPTPIVALTAYAMQDDVQKCLDAGCNAHVAKPVSKTGIISAIVQNLHRQENDSKRSSPPAENQEKIIIKPQAYMQDLAATYLDKRKKDSASLNEAMDKEDFETIEHLGHRMAGSGKSYGFTDISSIGLDLEHAAIRHDQKECITLLNQLSDYLERVEIHHA